MFDDGLRHNSRRNSLSEPMLLPNELRVTSRLAMLLLTLEAHRSQDRPLFGGANRSRGQLYPSGLASNIEPFGPVVVCGRALCCWAST